MFDLSGTSLARGTAGSNPSPPQVYCEPSCLSLASHGVAEHGAVAMMPTLEFAFCDAHFPKCRHQPYPPGIVEGAIRKRKIERVRLLVCRVRREPHSFMAANLGRNLVEGRARLIQAILQTSLKA